MHQYITVFGLWFLLIIGMGTYCTAQVDEIKEKSKEHHQPKQSPKEEQENVSPNTGDNSPDIGGEEDQHRPSNPDPYEKEHEPDYSEEDDWESDNDYQNDDWNRQDNWEEQNNEAHVEDEYVSNRDNGCFIGCVDGCCSMGGSVLVGLTQKYQKQLVSKEDSVPRVTSFETFFYGGGNTDTTLSFWPRLRINYGLFGTDFRLNTLTEPEKRDLNTYVTYDWQILLLNIVMVKSMTFRVGGGILYEELSETTYGELTVGTEVYLRDRQYRMSGEYRWSSIRQEGNLYGSYRFSTFRNLEFFVSAGGSYAQYYQTVSSWQVQIGFHLLWY